MPRALPIEKPVFFQTLLFVFYCLPLLLTANPMAQPRNVLGSALKSCCTNPMTGFYRDGFCKTGPNDYGVHVVCAQVTSEFLSYTKSRGNDLSSPVGTHFPGLKPGDKWCLCASRWLEAYHAGKAPKVVLESTHEKALSIIPLEILKTHAVDASLLNSKDHEL